MKCEILQQTANRSRFRCAHKVSLQWQTGNHWNDAEGHSKAIRDHMVR